MESEKDVCIIIGENSNSKSQLMHTWEKSLFVLDYKGEAWHLTSDYRKNVLHQKVIKFDPLCSDGSTSQWNPLSEIRFGQMRDEITDSVDLAEMLLTTSGFGCKHDNEAFKEESFVLSIAMIFLSSVILHMCYKFKKEDMEIPTLCDVLDFLNSADIESILTEMKALDTPATRQANNLENMPDILQHQVMLLTQEQLSIYGNLTVRGNTKKSDFRIRDIVWPTEETSLYLVVQTKDVNAARPIANLMVNIILKQCCKPIYIRYISRLLLILDNFTELGYVKNLRSAISTIDLHGVKLCLVCQDMKQLFDIYDKEIISNYIQRLQKMN